MRVSRHVDGNALGGSLIEIFGRDMTDATGCCGGCGAVREVAALLVYRAGPGDVLCCPVCATILMVIVPHPDGPRVYLPALRWLQPPII